MVDDDHNYQWTSKGPALLAGLAMLLGGALLINGRWRYSLPVAIGLMAAGAVTVAYSTRVHQWCAPRTARFDGMAFGSGLWHAPGAWDCVHLVYPYKRN